MEEETRGNRQTQQERVGEETKVACVVWRCGGMEGREGRRGLEQGMRMWERRKGQELIKNEVRGRTQGKAKKGEREGDN